MRLSSCAVALALALAGCGDGEDDEPGTTLVAGLGDSITAGAPLWDPDDDVRGRIEPAADPKSQYGYWAERRLRGTRFRNCGVSGDRTDQIAKRLDDCAEGAEVLIVQGGINDIAQGRSVATAARNLRAIVRRGLGLDLRVAIVEVLPWNNGYPGAVRPVKRLNRSIARIGRELGVPVYPWYRKLEDPARPGRVKAAWTSDGDHPSISGYRRLAEEVRLPSRARTRRPSSPP